MSGQAGHRTHRRRENCFWANLALNVSRRLSCAQTYVSQFWVTVLL
jgi:hypothetical protein